MTSGKTPNIAELNRFPNNRKSLNSDLNGIWLLSFYVAYEKTKTNINKNSAIDSLNSDMKDLLE